MAAIPSIGDLLMLSQLAWKIGRAFTKGRRGAPAEFLEVETECKGLTTALKLVAECLLADRSNIVYHADAETVASVATILNSCEHTLKDLESLLQQYQTVRTYRTSAGNATEVGWSDLVLHSYKTMMWTSEGGDVQVLRNMLNMHTQTITTTLQALQRCVTNFFTSTFSYTFSCFFLLYIPIRVKGITARACIGRSPYLLPISFSSTP